MIRLLLIVTVVVASGAQAGADRWLGEWMRDNASLDIRRDKADPTKIGFFFMVTTPRGCTGEAAGDVAAGELAKAAITLKAGVPDDAARDCEMLLKLTSDGRLTVDEGTCGALHGAACDFAGTYGR
jgi:hypothetical protein